MAENGHFRLAQNGPFLLALTLDFIFADNPIVPDGQEKIIQHGIYLGLTGHMQDSIDNLASKAENIIRNVAEMCGDVTYYYDAKSGVQQARVLGELFQGENALRKIYFSRSMDYFSRKRALILEI